MKPKVFKLKIKPVQDTSINSVT